MNGIGKIGQRHCNDRTLSTDLPFFHIEDLAFDSDFSHLFLHLFQRDRFIFKISSIEYIRVIASAVASAGTEGSSLAASAKASTIAGRAALLSATSFCSRCALSCCDCFRLLLFSGGFCLCLRFCFGGLLFPQILT